MRLAGMRKNRKWLPKNPKMSKVELGLEALDSIYFKTSPANTNKYRKSPMSSLIEQRFASIFRWHTDNSVMYNFFIGLCMLICNDHHYTP